MNQCLVWELNHRLSDRQTKILTTMPPLIRFVIFFRIIGCMFLLDDIFISYMGIDIEAAVGLTSFFANLRFAYFAHTSLVIFN